MPDYEKLYYTAMRELEKALRLLIAAQQKCEELYLQSCESEDVEKIIVLPKDETNS